ncbi:hypothetical protein [Salinigranum halophilum]|uniref:hypothetical protein n=1 Tax=Salinigranum halophilum TaxID=2565931 RepID=UPI0010A8C197|nr:hypothetical protein [Salinigranum halophilum]
MTSSEHDQGREAALRHARENRPWTAEVLLRAASDPGAFKATEPTCTNCSQPCEEDEVCATAVAQSQNLFESMGRDQVYHLLESGMRRLRARNEGVFRTADRAFPNTFVRLTGAQLATSDDDRK